MGIKAVNLGLAFALELGMLAALAYWGWRVGGSLPAQVALGVGAPLLAAMIWGRFCAPKSRTRLPQPRLVVLEVALQELAAVALAVAGQPALAVVYGALVLVNQALLVRWKQQT
jgi:hypothetical protein